MFCTLQGSVTEKHIMMPSFAEARLSQNKWTRQTNVMLHILLGNNQLDGRTVQSLMKKKRNIELARGL